MTEMLKQSAKATDIPQVHPGDIIRVHQKIKESGKERIQVFEGIVIKTHGKTGLNATFTVRKITYGVGVEKTFPLLSPSIVKIEFKKGSEVRRAKLYYLRELSGKSLKMKEKKIDRDVWELIAKTNEPEELTKEVLDEAVQAAKEKEEAEQMGQAESTEEPTTTEDQQIEEQPTAEIISTDESKSEKDGTVEGEASSVEETKEAQS